GGWRWSCKAPGVKIDGFALQPMIRRPRAQELILGVARDPIFGPVILFGAGGVAVELQGPRGQDRRLRAPADDPPPPRPGADP
ncbi:hypothetical protein CNY89_28965, partial [Amaricoccus sp. HAR-UPW-R2A-40]